MRSGAEASALVTAPSVTVTRGGVTRSVDSVSIERDLPSDLPASVVGGGGITAATGDVDWSQSVAVKSRDDSPWTPGAVPQPGEPVTVDMDAGAGSHRVFTGSVDSTSGGTGKVSASGLIDHVYRLHRRVSIEPLLRLGPPYTQAADYRRIGLTPMYVVDRVMRACGYYVTPPAEYDSAVSVPLQGSVWPEHGTCMTAGSSVGSSNSHASFYQADGRLYAGDFLATYNPRGTVKPITAATQLSVTVAQDHSGAFDLTAFYGTDRVTLRVTAGRTAWANFNGSNIPGSFLEVAGGARVSLLVKNGVWTLRTSTGGVKTVNQALSGSTPMSSLTASAAPGARVAGAIVSWPRNSTPDEHATMSFVRSARIRPGTAAHGLLDASPAIVNRRALDVLLEISKATCSPMWLDEDGILQWAGPDVLRSQAPAVTVTARTSLLSLDWRVTLDHVRHNTEVAWSKPQITVSRWAKVTLWEGRRETLEAGDEIRELISVPGDEDWVGVDVASRYAGSAHPEEEFNRGVRSWVGGYFVNSAGEPAGWVTPANVTASLSRITHDTYLHTMVVNSVTSGHRVATEVSPASAGLWPKWDGQALGILRGYGKAGWVPTQTSCAEDLRGPIDLPDLQHDAGYWVQHAGINPDAGNVPLRLANWIAGQVRTPAPEVTGFKIMPDPRIQLGDVIAVEDPDNLGVAFTALVVGNNLAQSGPGQSMNLSLHVISANPTHATYDALQALWAGANYAALESAWAGQTYAAIEANPIKETP